ncbi:MAG: DUF177 domain-containing protein [Caldilineaceae bacterium]|nr:DUF177 domain-containing protein [Caldilineaceae bacterium]
MTCNRCLFPIAAPVRCSVEESFHPLTDVGTGRYIHPSEFEGSAQELEDPALIIDEQHILDISEIVRQALWLSLPMYPGCNWEGESQCPNLAIYLSDVGEMEAYSLGAELPATENEEVDPRWAALLALRGKMDEEA